MGPRSRPHARRGNSFTSLYPLFTASRRSSSNHDIIEATSLLTHVLYLALARLVGLRSLQGTGALVLEYEVRPSGEGFYDRFGSCEKPHDKEMSGVGRSDWPGCEL